MKTSIMGLNFDNVTMAEALEKAEQMLTADGAQYIVTPNAEIAYEAMHAEELRTLINGAAMVLPDGAGVVLASKILGKKLKQKVAGVDFADGLLSVLEKTGKTLYLLGSKPGIGELAAEKMLLKHPHLNICGIADGYFKDEAPVVEKINASGADVLFVCLGAPKQEQFMKRHQNALHVRMMIGLGGSLDSFAGTVKRAPKWMIRLSLEWLYRLIKEPKRFKRMLRLPKYLLAVVAERIRGKKKWEN
ncbi:MAG: WecB/TagA/CpsF family glycosyltransferase [Oscillospiraceae bacterium]|nr:WecB/TagA/CpsF family glycosyltransferase [Oscillospiraceae bacterium]MBQ5749496.1 WecB/TagA/CpsF family glycosyltransferase [Oscillospiraceae bacterium]